MLIRLRLCLLAIPLAASPIEAQQTSIQMASDIHWATHHAVAELQQNGMQGLIDDVKKCYDITMRPAYRCVYLDIAAWHIDEDMNHAAGLPVTHAYLGNEAIFHRANDEYRSAGMDQRGINQQLRNAIAIISSEVDRELASNTSMNDAMKH